MVQNFELSALQRRAYAGIHSGMTAATDLIWPPSCPLCNRSPPAVKGVPPDFCTHCAAALSESENLTRAACLRCGVPKADASTKPDNSASQSDAETRHTGEQGNFDAKVSETAAVPKPSRFESYSCETANPATDRVHCNTPAKCAHCLHQKFVFESILPLWLYQNRVREVVLAAKLAHHTALNATLGRRLGARVREFQGQSSKFDLVTYVPSHFSRQFARCGNGNQIIAEEVGKSLGVPCRKPLRITRRICKQAWLGDQARVGNVSGAFSVKKSYAWGRSGPVAGKRILLVDDVMTTGATANEVSRVLLASGARGVCLAVVARAIRFF
jgi:competence protein ComFC